MTEQGIRKSAAESQGAQPESQGAQPVGFEMIEVEGLGKSYGVLAAVKDVSFSVPRAQVAAFLGPNGAGKSTTMKLLTGYLSPTTGRIRMAGFDIETQRRQAVEHIGYLPENGPLYDEMTPEGLLTYLGRARGLHGATLNRRLDYVLETCSLGEVWRKQIAKLSRGFRQRVGMAQALLHDPDILILDEPTSGLDPNQLVGIRQLIRDLGREKTILLSTHILQEVEAVCSRVLLIHEGRLVFDGPLEEMGDEHRLEERFHELTGAAV